MNNTNETKPLDAAELEELRFMVRDEEAIFFPATVRRLLATLDLRGEELLALKAANRWRDVREELPPFVRDDEDEEENCIEISEDVLIWVDGQFLSAYRSRVVGRKSWSWILNAADAFLSPEDVTHWKPLPALPEEERDG